MLSDSSDTFSRALLSSFYGKLFSESYSYVSDLIFVKVEDSKLLASFSFKYSCVDWLGSRNLLSFVEFVMKAPFWSIAETLLPLVSADLFSSDAEGYSFNPIIF